MDKLTSNKPLDEEHFTVEQAFLDAVTAFNAARGSGFEYGNHCRNPERNPTLVTIEKQAATAYVDLIVADQKLHEKSAQETMTIRTSRWNKFWFPNSTENRRMQMLIEEEFVRRITRPQIGAPLWIPDSIGNVRSRLSVSMKPASDPSRMQ
ncbi:MAG: hypothetical protein Q7S29_02140 [Candidatus Peribacter sp.]|nr:hypothetical protein [Candidatus Peribacter sp.]